MIILESISDAVYIRIPSHANRMRDATNDVTVTSS